MARLSELYGLALDLLDKRDGAGRLDPERLRSLAARAPAVTSVLRAELACLLELPACGVFTELSEDVDLPDFAAVGVLPWGLAAELARQGGDLASAQVFYGRYEAMKRRLRLPAGQIADDELALRGLTGGV